MQATKGEHYRNLTAKYPIPCQAKGTGPTSYNKIKKIKSNKEN